MSVIIVDDDIVQARCKHGHTGYCFDCMRERHNQEVLDGKYVDVEPSPANPADRAG